MESAAPIVEIDEGVCIIKIKRGASKEPLPKSLSIGQLGQIDSKIIRTSEPGYFIKNLETFYVNKRANAVATAAYSIIVYNGQFDALGLSPTILAVAHSSTQHCAVKSTVRNTAMCQSNSCAGSGLGWAQKGIIRPREA